MTAQQVTSVNFHDLSPQQQDALLGELVNLGQLDPLLRVTVLGWQYLQSALVDEDETVELIAPDLDVEGIFTAPEFANIKAELIGAHWHRYITTSDVDVLAEEVCPNCGGSIGYHDGFKNEQSREYRCFAVCSVCGAATEF